jgi:nitroimidazol reductase NimA-like FMN-containing flavoprotein (pyridoxamine 5'-phosphate oxidase superfamily)
MIDMPTTECLQLLKTSLVARLGMVAPDGRPYTIPMRFVWHNDAVYCRLAYDGRKQEAFEFARHVCFETDEVRDDFSHYASVIIEGTLLDISDEAEKHSALVALNDKYAQLCGIPTPGPNPVTRGVAIRKILVESLSGRKREPDPEPLQSHRPRSPLATHRA